MNLARRVRIGGLLVILAAGGRSAQAQSATDQTTLPPTTPPNQISITATVPTAYAAAGIAGVFEITRSSENVLGDVTISYKVGGQAVAGHEYKELKLTRVIPAGQTTVKVKVHPLAVAGSSGTVKGVKVTLLEGNGYALTAATKAKVKVVQ